MKTKKSAALKVTPELKVASATPCEGPAPSASHISVRRRGAGREHELPMTGRRALHSARRACNGREVGGIEDQLAGSVIDETVAQAQPVVAGIDPDAIMFRPRSP